MKTPIILNASLGKQETDSPFFQKHLFSLPDVKKNTVFQSLIFVVNTQLPIKTCGTLQASLAP